MTTMRFPTPAELRAERQRKADVEVADAMEKINAAMLADDRTVQFPWSEPAREVIVERLRAAGWIATYTNNQRDGAWLKFEAAGPGPMDEFYAAGDRRGAP